ncbi:MAG: asparagine synthase-related protein, partial [Conexibacter sp.]
MSRTLVGRFERDARSHPAGAERLASALAPQEARRIDLGPLSVACDGAPVDAEAPVVCLLDGVLDDTIELAAALGLATRDPERLVAAAYARWGEAALRRLRGDFALLLWEPARRRGLLVRDPLGVRGLYWHADGRTLTFGSEVRHVLAALPRRPAPDHDAVAAWIASASRRGDATLYAGVRRLRPGGLIRFGADGWEPRRWWEPRYAAPLRAAPPERDAAVRAALTRAVARRMSPGLTAVTLSGGLDSSAVAGGGGATGGAGQTDNEDSDPKNPPPP